MKLKVLALPVLALVASAYAVTPFTQQSNHICTTIVRYMTDGSLGTRFTCALIPTGAGYQSLYADLNNDGTFVGQFTAEDAVTHDFYGTWVGTGTVFHIPISTAANPSALSGSWGTCSVTSIFGMHYVSGYRGSKLLVPYLSSGNGVE